MIGLFQKQEQLNDIRSTEELERDAMFAGIARYALERREGCAGGHSGRRRNTGSSYRNTDFPGRNVRSGIAHREFAW